MEKYVRLIRGVMRETVSYFLLNLQQSQIYLKIYHCSIPKLLFYLLLELCPQNIRHPPTFLKGRVFKIHGYFST